MGRIEELESKIIEAKRNYYNLALGDTAKYTDQEFDAMVIELKELKPDSPVLGIIGTDVLEGEKDNLHQQMVSTSKCLSPEEMKTYWNRISGYASDSEPIVESLKIDGLSLNNFYVNGHFVKCLTSGDGFKGVIKTSKALAIPSIPKELGVDFTGVVSGEVYLSTPNFEKLNEILREEGSKEQANERNSAAGLINSVDLKNADRKLALLTFRAWGLYEGETDIFGSYDLYSRQLEKAKELGFLVTEYHMISKKEFDSDWSNNWIAEQDYPCDGTVLRINSQAIARQMGTGVDNLQAATAYKPPAEFAVVEVKDITWQQGSQEFSPLVHFDPVQLAGAVVRKASGGSIHNMLEKNCYVGSKVKIVRSGGVIPMVQKFEG